MSSAPLLPPEITASAWPIVRPGGTPGNKADHGVLATALGLVDQKLGAFKGWGARPSQPFENDHFRGHDADARRAEPRQAGAFAVQAARWGGVRNDKDVIPGFDHAFGGLHHADMGLHSRDDSSFAVKSAEGASKIAAFDAGKVHLG